MRARSFLAVLCLALSFVAAGCDDDDGTTGTSAEVHVATLSGANEVPPNPSAATGTGSFTINGATVDYRVEVQGLVDIVGAHIHSGAAGANGPVRVDLLPNAVSGPTNGLLSQGTFSAAEVRGITYDELLAEIRAGTAYVNVHTSTYPAGEIRGQTTRQQ
jgi:hypothetical protein